MSYDKKRTDYNNSWPNAKIEFSGQVEYRNLLEAKGITNILLPIQLPVISDYHFQRLLSFKIDIYEQLPDRPDIGFDLAWRTFEAYSTYFSVSKSWTSTKTHIILNKVCEDILINQFNNNQPLKDAVETMLNSIPLQATEFLVRRLFETAQYSTKSQQDKIRERVKACIGNLYDDLNKKYTPLTPETQRQCGMFVQILLAGREVTIEGNTYRLSLLDRLKFLVNGILYSYRNERFHGDSFSPFKSSKTAIKTYAHSYFCLISTYFFLCQLIYADYPGLLNIADMTVSLTANITRYNDVFLSQRRK